jgi:hypothetical protein
MNEVTINCASSRSIWVVSFSKRFYFVALFLAFCSVQAELPPLISREILLGNPTRRDPKISPHGSQLSWLAPDKNSVLNAWVNAIDGTNLHPVANEASRPIGWYKWAANGEHILYFQHNAGDEVQHLLG